MGIPAFNDFLSIGSSAVMPFFNRYRAEEEAREQADANADLLEARAERKDRDAEDAIKIGLLDQADQVRKGRQDVAGKRVSFAASGVRVDAGSALAVAADTAAWSEYGRQRVEYDANLKSWGLEYDAALLRAEASAVRAGVRV